MLFQKGDKDDVTHFSNETIRIVDLSENTRNPDSIFQKYIIGFKYIIRIAAEKGGVHPTYIDNI